MDDNFGHGGNILAVARLLGVEPTELCDFSASINPLGMARGVREAVLEDFDLALHYPDNEAMPLRLALAELHGVDPGQLVIGNGSAELICILPRLFGRGKGLIVAPAFSEYAKALSVAGMEVHHLTLRPEEGFRVRLDELERRLDEGFQMLFLCNPGNPTGALIPQDIIGKIIDLCRSAGTFPVIDEAFMDFSEDQSAKHLVLNDDMAIVLRSMTKFYAIPGLRVGFGIASNETVRRLEQFRTPWSVNTLAQIAALASLRDHGHRERTVSFVEEERSYLARGIALIDGLKSYPSAANYLLIGTGGRFTAAELREKLLERMVLIRDCTNFTGMGNRFIRVAVRGREENDALLAGLREIYSPA